MFVAIELKVVWNWVEIYILRSIVGSLIDAWWTDPSTQPMLKVYANIQVKNPKGGPSIGDFSERCSCQWLHGKCPRLRRTEENHKHFIFRSNIATMQR